MFSSDHREPDWPVERWQVSWVQPAGLPLLKSQSNHASYTLFYVVVDWDAITIDPVCTGAPGWQDFLDAYNGFCSDHDGKPLLNQTPRLTREQMAKAFGDRIAQFESHRRRFDPENRLLNGFFRDLLAVT